MIRLITCVLLVFVGYSTIAQRSSEDDKTTVLLEEAKKLNQEGRYQEANKKFRQILSLNEAIPSEMCYHFAETLYAIGQYQNSKNFIQKYFDLTGQAGDNYKEVKKLEALVEGKLVAIRDCHRCNTTGYRYFPCQTCHQHGEVTSTCYYCKGHGIAPCTKCKGDGVIIFGKALGGSEYHTCDRCDGKGIETCPICNGDKLLTTPCPTCGGFLFEPSSSICDHKDHPEDGFVVPYVFEKSTN